MTRINVIFHSVTGSTARLAQAIAEGVESLDGCTAALKQIPELPGQGPVTMANLPAHKEDFAALPVATTDDMLDCDGFAFGTAVYWGNMSYAAKYFLDGTANLYQLTAPDQPATPNPGMFGKPATVFTGGGNGLANEPAILSIYMALSFFGVTLVTMGPRLPEVTDPKRHGGGNTLGAGTFSRVPGERPSEDERAIARAQGRALAETARAWKERRRD
jgi:NAD(P)H dehydrogenase (quinone)